MNNIDRLKLMLTIEISYVCPPVPNRYWDYMAFLKDDPEYGEIGTGSTKWIALREAIQHIWEMDRC